MKYCLLILLLLFPLQDICAQSNLVPNPSFEEVTEYPPGSALLYCKDWFIARETQFTGYDNYYNKNGTDPLKKVPKSVTGYQLAHTGVAYCASVTAYNHFEKDNCQYLEARLKQPLKKGVTYKIGFYASLAETYLKHFNCLSGDLGLYISDTLVDTYYEDVILPFTPQLVEHDYNRLSDTINWVKLSGEYQAHGGEEYILIGVFVDVSTINTTCDRSKDFFFYYYIDDVYVIEPDLPQPELPADTALCAGDSLLLGSGLPGSPYLSWPDGSHDSTFMARGPGTYWVRYDSADHHSWDSIVIAEKKIQFELPFTDTTPCPGSSFVLQLPEVPGRTYHWPDGMAGNSYKIDTSGTVQIIAREGNCAATRELKVSYHNRRQRYELPADTLLCKGESLLLEVSPAYGELQWPDGSRGESYSIKRGGEYTLQIENECDKYSTTIRVEEEVCDCHLYLPNAITIDGNTLNDTFKVTAECLLPDFRMRIYNRWGELLFESTDPAIGWPGAKGAQREGIYLYTISATASNGERIYRSGTITVVY